MRVVTVEERLLNARKRALLLKAGVSWDLIKKMPIEMVDAMLEVFQPREAGTVFVHIAVEVALGLAPSPSP